MAEDFLKAYLRYLVLHDASKTDEDKQLLLNLLPGRPQKQLTCHGIYFAHNPSSTDEGLRTALIDKDIREFLAEHGAGASAQRVSGHKLRKLLRPSGRFELYCLLKTVDPWSASLLRFPDGQMPSEYVMLYMLDVFPDSLAPGPAFDRFQRLVLRPK